MSLLMEALRKAEAAKNKADGKDVDDSSSLSLEPQENINAAEPDAAPTEELSPPSPSPDDQQQETEHETDIEEIKFKLEAKPKDETVHAVAETEIAEARQTASEIADELLRETPSEESFELTMDGYDEFDSAIPEAEEYVDSPKDVSQEETLEVLDKKIGGADELSGYIPEESFEEASESQTNQEEFAPQEAEEELSQFERSNHHIDAETQSEESHLLSGQAVIDRQTANSLFQAKQSSLKNKRNRAIMLGLLVALLPIGGGGFYWYYSSSSTNSMFPANASLTPPPQGFLGDLTAPEANTETAETVAAIDSNIADETEVVLTEDLDLEAIVAVVEETEVTQLTVPDSAEDSSPVTTNTTTLIPGNTQSNPADNALVAGNEGDSENNSAPEIRLTRTTSRLEVDPDLLAAYESYQQNDLGQARRLYAQVLETRPNSRDALLGLALINRQEGNIAQAQALYSRLLQLNPRDPLARAGLLESGQNTTTAQQESQLRALQNEYPNVAPLAFALGNLFASQSRWNEAQNAYFDALLIANEVDSNTVSPDYAFNLAVSLERLNQLDLAYNYYQQALDLSTSSPAGFNMDNLNQRMAYLEEVLQ